MLSAVVTKMLPKDGIQVLTLCCL